MVRISNLLALQDLVLAYWFKLTALCSFSNWFMLSYADANGVLAACAAGVAEHGARIYARWSFLCL